MKDLFGPFTAPVALLVLLAQAAAASAQSTTPVPNPAQGDQRATPLQLQLPAQPVVAESPAEASDNAIVDAHDNAVDDSGHGPQVHGAFTAGVGYSKGYGTSTMEAADLDISGQSDSGRTYDVQIHLLQSKGPGFDRYGGYYGIR